MAKTFVLVHGAFAGKYAWQAVQPLLEAQGNKVLALDLPRPALLLLKVT
jgi:pimeloyl-ACP methyl ester carboxylesterase